MLDYNDFQYSTIHVNSLSELPTSNLHNNFVSDLALAIVTLPKIIVFDFLPIILKPIAKRIKEKVKDEIMTINATRLTYLELKKTDSNAKYDTAVAIVQEYKNNLVDNN